MTFSKSLWQSKHKCRIFLRKKLKTDNDYYDAICTPYPLQPVANKRYGCFIYMKFTVCSPFVDFEKRSETMWHSVRKKLNTKIFLLVH